MSETCLAHKKWNKIASDIKLVFYSSTSFGLSLFLYYFHLAFSAYIFKGISCKRDELPLNLRQLLCVFILPAPVAARSKAPHTLSVKLSDFIVWRYTWRKNWVNCAVLTGKYRRPQNCLFQSSFTQRTAQLTQEIPLFPQFTSRHHDGIISRHISF